MSKPLLYMFQPKNIDDMILPVTIRQRFKQKIENKCVDNMIISGGTGVGKTLVMKLLIKEIYKDELKPGCLMLDTACNRGLKELKTLIEQFCIKEVSALKNKCINKLVFLDDADNITKKAKNMINNISDIYTNINFVFICNDKENMTDGIKSKSEFLFMENIKTFDIYNKLEEITKKIQIPYSEEGLTLIAKNAKGDIRKAINNLDSVATCYSNISFKNVNNLSFQPKSKELNYLINSCINKNFREAIEHLKEIKNKGYCYFDILVAMIKVLKNSSLVEEIKINFINCISLTLVTISKGMETDIQIYNCIVQMIKS